MGRKPEADRTDDPQQKSGGEEYNPPKLPRLFFAPQSAHSAAAQGTDGIEVRKMYIAQGVPWDPEIEPWFVKKKDLKKSKVYPLPLNVDQAVWRNNTAYLGWRSDEWGYFPPQNLCLYQRYWEVANTEKAQLAPVAIFALASDKAKFFAWRHETLDLPVEAIEGSAEGDAMQNTLLNDIQNALTRLEDLERILRGGLERYYRAIFPKNKNDKKERMYQKKARTSAAHCARTGARSNARFALCWYAILQCANRWCRNAATKVFTKQIKSLWIRWILWWAVTFGCLRREPGPRLRGTMARLKQAGVTLEVADYGRLLDDLAKWKAEEKFVHWVKDFYSRSYRCQIEPVRINKEKVYERTEDSFGTTYHTLP